MSVTETRDAQPVLVALSKDLDGGFVELRHVNDLPITEIAGVLGCPPGTVKSHISRGLRRLRELSAAHPDVCEVSDDQR